MDKQVHIVVSPDPDRNDIILNAVSPDPLLMWAEGREVLRITQDRRLIIASDIYQAARDFWELVRLYAPKDWLVEEAQDA